MVKSFKLNDGITIPSIGLGTWQSSKEDAYTATLSALKAGYRLIDTALAYGNEDAVGKAIKDSNIKRDDIFVTTKLPAQYKSYEEAIKYCNESLRNLGLDYIDLYLIHAPWPWTNVGEDYEKENIEVWKAFIDLKKDGKVRSIGVSNFRPNNLENIINATNVVPSVNQIRFFIGNTQEEVTKYCMDHNILIEAYSPLGTGEILNAPELDNICKKYNKSKAQICIRYCIERGTIPLPKSVHEERIIANLDVDFKMDEEDILYLNSLSIGSRRPFRS